MSKNIFSIIHQATPKPRFELKPQNLEIPDPSHYASHFLDHSGVEMYLRASPWLTQSRGSGRGVRKEFSWGPLDAESHDLGHKCAISRSVILAHV